MFEYFRNFIVHMKKLKNNDSFSFYYKIWFLCGCLILLPINCLPLNAISLSIAYVWSIGAIPIAFLMFRNSIRSANNISSNESPMIPLRTMEPLYGAISPEHDEIDCQQSPSQGDQQAAPHPPTTHIATGTDQSGLRRRR